MATAVIVFLALAACAGGEPQDTGLDLGDPLDWAIDEPGPLDVGFHAESLDYTTALGETRTVVFNLWYPTLDPNDVGTRYLDIWEDADVHTDAAPAAPLHDGGYPVHVYSHGYQGFGGTSAFLMRHLASHGWVVVAPDHTNNTLTDHRDPLPTAHYVHRPQDISGVLDHLAASADTLLAGTPDVSRVVLSGHSFGAYTTWSAGGAAYDPDAVAERCGGGNLAGGDCTEAELAALTGGGLADPRVVGTLPMAGNLDRGWFGDSGERSVSGPVLMMAGSNDDVGQYAMWDALGDIDYTWVELEGGCHQSFALGQCSTLDVDEGFRIVRAYGLAFSRAVVLGDAGVAGILDGSETVGAAATVQVR